MFTMMEKGKEMDTFLNNFLFHYYLYVIHIMFFFSYFCKFVMFILFNVCVIYQNNFMLFG